MRLRIAWTLGGVSLALFFCGFGSVEAERKPNVILIITDDHGYADLSCQGIVSDIRTPHIDSLAAHGVRMTAGYATAPQCTPSRAGIVVGRYQNRFGIEDNQSPKGRLKAELTIAERLQTAGYTTGMVGKWHLGKPWLVREHGFDDVYISGGTWSNFNLAGFDLKPGFRSSSAYHIDGVSAAACAFIKRHKSHPFFLHVAYVAPHTPLNAPDKYLDRFPEQMPWRRRQALAMLSAVDGGVGRILNTLKNYELTKETLVFFVSDHGAQLQLDKSNERNRNSGWNGSLNDPLSGEKGMLSEGGIRIPFLISWPDVLPSGLVYDSPVSTLDIAATILGAASLAEDAALDGVCLTPYLLDEKSEVPHESLFWRWGTQSAIRRGNWKYIRAGERELLFDLNKDIAELDNRIEEHRELANELSKALKEWAADLNPPGLSDSALSAKYKAYYDFHHGSGDDD